MFSFIKSQQSQKDGMTGNETKLCSDNDADPINCVKPNIIWVDPGGTQMYLGDPTGPYEYLGVYTGDLSNNFIVDNSNNFVHIGEPNVNYYADMLNYLRESGVSQPTPQG